MANSGYTKNSMTHHGQLRVEFLLFLLQESVAGCLLFQQQSHVIHFTLIKRIQNLCKFKRAAWLTL